MPGLAQVSRSRSGLLPPACHLTLAAAPHTILRFTACSAVEAGAPRPEARLPPVEGLQEGSAPRSQANSRTQRLPVCPQGCASGGAWGLELQS